MEAAVARQCRRPPTLQDPHPVKTCHMGDNRNFIIAIFLSVVVFVGWQYFFIDPQLEAERARQEAVSERSGTTADTAPGTSAPGEARLPTVDEPARSTGLA